MNRSTTLRVGDLVTYGSWERDAELATLGVYLGYVPFDFGTSTTAGTHHGFFHAKNGRVTTTMPFLGLLKRVALPGDDR